MVESLPAHVEGLTTVSQTWGACSVQIILNGNLLCTDSFLNRKFEVEHIVATRIGNNSMQLLIRVYYDSENSWIATAHSLSNLRFLWDTGMDWGPKHCYITLT